MLKLVLSKNTSSFNLLVVQQIFLHWSKEIHFALRFIMIAISYFLISSNFHDSPQVVSFLYLLGIYSISIFIFIIYWTRYLGWSSKITSNLIRCFVYTVYLLFIFLDFSVILFILRSIFNSCFRNVWTFLHKLKWWRVFKGQLLFAKMHCEKESPYRLHRIRYW